MQFTLYATRLPSTAATRCLVVNLRPAEVDVLRRLALAERRPIAEQAAAILLRQLGLVEPTLPKDSAQ